MTWVKQNWLRVMLGAMILATTLFVFLINKDYTNPPSLVTVTETHLPENTHSISNKSEYALPDREAGVAGVANPTFNEVVAANNVVDGHCGRENPYLGKEVRWRAKTSSYAHTSGIRFLVIDKDHALGPQEKHGPFWGVFLVSSKDDPRETEDGLEKWWTVWDSSWVKYILGTYGNIRDEDRTYDTEYLVNAVIDYVACGDYGSSSDMGDYDGGYIETIVKKIEIVKK